MTEVKLPELGDGIESGDILEIFVAVGDVIREGQDIVEMETDKATVAVPAAVGGKVTKILVGEGDTVPIGGTILEVEAVAGAETTPVPEEIPEAGSTKPKTKSKTKAKASKKAAQQEPAQQERSPIVTPAPVPQPVPQGESQSTTPDASQSVIAAGPAIRRFAREVGVDLSRVVGTGDQGRITREDVLAVVRSAGKSATVVEPAKVAKSTTAEESAPELPGTPGSDDYGPTRTEKMSKVRKTIAKAMHASWSNVPRVTNFDNADVTDLEQLRQSSKKDYAEQGLKLTTMPFLIKAVATALSHNPIINAVIDQENEQVIYKDYINVGIAVDTDRGLVVPVIHNTDQLGVPEVARALAEMAGKVRGGDFALSDIRGGTFSISNLGAIGGQYSTPIVNFPEVAILLVGRSRKMPVVMPDDSIQPRLMMPLSISYDHRLIDGAAAARFLNDVIGYLEAPSRLLLAL